MKIILTGPPGSGKGTMSERLCKDFKLLHVSPGELLREEVRKGTTIGKEIKGIMEKGDLVPNKFVVEIVKLQIEGKKNYILDGFPRSVDQAKEIEDFKVDLVIYLEVSEKVVVERFAGRRMCKNNHGYHIKYLPPKKKGICDKDGLPLRRRKDDNPKVVKERFKVYRKRTQPVINYYKRKGILRKVDGTPLPDEVYKEVKKVVKEV